MKLWNKGYDVDALINKFTVGDDHLLDQRLVPYDCQASLAHAKMLEKIGLLSSDESKQLIEGLKAVIELHSQRKFEIKSEDEDCHTAIENYLTKNYGDVGKKIHVARSRNDQVLVAIRLYEKEFLAFLKNKVSNLQKSLSNIVKKKGKTGIPGYTHMQRAMPATIAMWLGSFIDSFEDDKLLIESAQNLINQNPLGTAAGFGVPVIPIDRELTTEQLGFSKTQKNPMYAQLSRGKFEVTILHCLSQVMLDVSKLATDLILFSMKEFGFVKLAKEFCTGSSIMPQKNNPDVLELLRAKYHVVIGEELKIKGLISGLMSGYNRDVQLTKGPLFVSIDTTLECLEVMSHLLGGVEIDSKSCSSAMSKELYATGEAYKLVKQGVPFRDAYRSIGNKYS